MSDARVSLVVAATENGTIGRDNELPWHLPDDLRRFKALTMGSPLVMGRRTFESIGRPLPGRRNLVLSRGAGYSPPGVEVYGSLDAALSAAAAPTATEPVDDDPADTMPAEIFIIGGADVFAEALPRADRVYLTLVHTELDGDVFFPPLDQAEWRLVGQEHHAADAAHAFAFTFQTYDRNAD